MKRQQLPHIDNGVYTQRRVGASTEERFYCFSIMLLRKIKLLHKLTDKSELIERNFDLLPITWLLSKKIFSFVTS